MVRRRQHLSPAAIAKREEGYGIKKGMQELKREREGVDGWWGGMGEREKRRKGVWVIMITKIRRAG